MRDGNGWFPHDDGFTDYDDAAPFLERPREGPIWPWLVVLVVCVLIVYTVMF